MYHHERPHSTEETETDTSSNSPKESKQIQADPNSLQVSVRSAFQVCTALLRFPSKDSVCRRRRCLLCYRRSRAEIGLSSSHVMKNTEMSPTTMSNSEMQPESERRVHQFQDSLLDVTSFMEVMVPKSLVLHVQSCTAPFPNSAQRSVANCHFFAINPLVFRKETK